MRSGVQKAVVMTARMLVVTLLLCGVATAQIRVGVDVGDISPRAKEGEASCLGGYGLPYSRCGVVAINDPITVRAIFIGDGEQHLLLVVFDTVGLGSRFIRDTTKAIAERMGSVEGVDEEAIVLAATHTHAGPDLQGLWGGIDDEYRERIINITISVASRAVTKARAAIAYVAEAPVETRNRRGMPYVDKTAEALQFRDQDTGDVIATLVSISAHPTILGKDNERYSSGYVHFIRSEVEREYGGSTVFVNSILGDAEPDVKGRNHQAMRIFGVAAARSIIDALRSPSKVNGAFAVEFSQFAHHVSNWLIRFATFVGLLDLDLENGEMSTRLGVFSFGDDVGGILFPGEALSSLGATIQRALPVKHRLFFGLSGDTLGYFIPSREYDAVPGRDTEESVCVDPSIGDDVEVAFVQLIRGHWAARGGSRQVGDR